MSTLRVREIIALLQRFDSEAEVEVEGCDCIGVANGVVTREDFYAKGLNADFYRGDKNVIITREP